MSDYNKPGRKHPFLVALFLGWIEAFPMHLIYLRWRRGKEEELP